LGGIPWEEDRSVTTISASRPGQRRSVGAVLAIVLLALAAAGCMPADAKTFLDRTNALRASHGVAGLKEHDTLTRKAEAWAQHMAATGRLEHSNLSADLGSLQWRALAENVGYSTPTGDTLKTIHDAFVGSSGHRANLLRSTYTHMGVGVAQDGRGRVWVAEVFAAL
jgi:uncharacterized protein YkwD